MGVVVAHYCRSDGIIALTPMIQAELRWVSLKDKDLNCPWTAAIDSFQREEERFSFIDPTNWFLREIDYM